MSAPILIVDDDRSISRSLELLLKSKGHSADTCALVQEAIEKVTAAIPPYKVVLSDVRLPDGSGLDLIEQIQERSPGTKIILMTGYAAEDLKLDPRAAKADLIFTKPIPLAEFFATIATMLA